MSCRSCVGPGTCPVGHVLVQVCPVGHVLVQVHVL